MRLWPRAGGAQAKQVVGGKRGGGVNSYQSTFARMPSQKKSNKNHTCHSTLFFASLEEGGGGEEQPSCGWGLMLEIMMGRGAPAGLTGGRGTETWWSLHKLGFAAKHRSSTHRTA